MESTWKHFQYDPHANHVSCRDDVLFNECDRLLRSEWDRAMSEGLFTFAIDHHAKRRTLDDGGLNYVIELNPSRYEKRRTPYPFEHVNTPFDGNKFNFNKIKDTEVRLDAMDLLYDRLDLKVLFSLDNNQHQLDRNLVIINNAPIRPYHVLLVPDRQREQSQILTIDAILFGLRFVASSAHPYIFAGFNSLCAYASINHLHLHGLYLPDRLFVQTIKCAPFHGKTNCYLLDVFDVQAFAFEIRNSDECNRIARHVFTIAEYLTASNIAHSMGIVKGDSFSSSSPALRIFLWFRQSVIHGKMFERCNFACLELSGFMVLQFDDVFNELTADELIRHLRAVALPAEERQHIRDDVKHLLDKSLL